MKKKITKEKARIYRWEGISNGIEYPEITLGYIVIERCFKVFDDGHMRLDTSYPEKLLTMNEQPINCLWNMATLQEFFPGFTGCDFEGEV